MIYAVNITIKNEFCSSDFKNKSQEHVLFPIVTKLKFKVKLQHKYHLHITSVFII